MRGRSARRIQALTTNPEFVDAFVESELPLSTRRALRKTCRMWRCKMEEFMMRPTLVLREQDCTDPDAKFVLDPLLRRHREVNLRLEGGGHVAEINRLCRWMAKHEFADNEPDRPWFKSGEKVLVTLEKPNPTEAFFKGRIAAKLTRAAIQITFDKPAENGHMSLRESTETLKTGAHLSPEVREVLKPDDWRLLAGCARKCAAARVKQLRQEYEYVFNLSNVRLDDAGARWLCDHASRAIDALDEKRGNRHWLYRLDLANTATPISCGILPYLGTHFAPSKRIQTLYLRHNSFPQYPGMMEALVAACKGGALAQLQVLRLDDTDFRDQEMEQLAPCFKTGGGLDRLELLDLDENHLTGVGLDHFKRHAKYMTKLQTLEMEDNEFSLEAVHSLAFWIVEKSKWCNIRKVSAPVSALCFADHTQRTEAGKLIRSSVRNRRQRWRWEVLVRHARCMTSVWPLDRVPQPDVGSSSGTESDPESA